MSFAETVASTLGLVRVCCAVIPLVSACSYPIAPATGEHETILYAKRVQAVLSPRWGMSRDYNPYGFATLLIRTQDNRRFIRLPYGSEGFLELVIYLSARPNIGQLKITQGEFVRKFGILSEIDRKQRELHIGIRGRDAAEWELLEYLPVVILDEPRITEFNKLVDQRWTNEENFPRHHTETFGVTFQYPKRHEIDGLDNLLVDEFLELVEKVKAVFPRYQPYVQ